MLRIIVAGVSRVGLASLLVALLIGCRSAERATAEDAVICPKCETVWIEAPDPDDLYVLTYRSEQVTRCPDCSSAVATFFRTGELRHSCASCGGRLVHCTLH